MNLQIMKQFLLSQPQSDNALGLEETKNANIDNNIGDLIEKSKDFTIFISEIHRYTAEIRGFIWISR